MAIRTYGRLFNAHRTGFERNKRKAEHRALGPANFINRDQLNFVGPSQ